MTRLANLGIMVASLLVGVLALEGLVRVADLGVHDRLAEMTRYGLILEQDPGGYPRHIPNTTLWSEGTRMDFNGLGMRDIDPTLPKPPGMRRLLLVGDSVLVGPKVPQDRIASARLRTGLAPSGIDVVTGAVSGWNTVFEAKFVATNLSRLAPDAIVLVYVENDNEIALPFDLERQPPKTARERLYRWLVVHSRLFEWGVFAYRQRYPDWQGLSRMETRRQAREAAGIPFSTEDLGWRESRAALERIADMARQRGVPFVVVLFRYAAGGSTDRVLERLTEFSAATGVPVVDAMPWYADHPAAALVVSMFDPHPNVEGHERLARGILGLVEPGGPASPSPREAPRPAPVE
jgi:hypothetical protein